MYSRVGLAHKAAVIVCLVSTLSVERAWAHSFQPAAEAAALHEQPRQSEPIGASNRSMPEAASLALFALSLIGLAVVARRRRQRQ